MIIRIVQLKFICSDRIVGNNPHPETASNRISPTGMLQSHQGKKITSEEYFRADRKGWNIMEKKIKQ